MYKIMTVVKSGENNTSTYQFLKVKDEDGNFKVWSADSKTDLETQVESMLNGDYAKKDFIVVEPFNYELDTDIKEGSDTDSSTTPDTSGIAPSTADDD